MKRALTGIQPSGTVHLGNWLGALRPAVRLQEQFSTFYFIADLHALTSTDDPERVRRASRELAATFLALGLDPERATLFRQSSVPEVCELAWILGCTIPVGVLERGHAVKAAKDAGREVNVGTLYYPVLMAADILLYDANVVPVGKDQKQHVEVARDIATKMNHRYGADVIVVPEVVIQEDVGVIPGLDGRKMSKSYGNAIALWDSPKALRKQVMRITTDSKEVADPKDPDSCHVFQLFRTVASADAQHDLRARYLAGGMGYGEAKQALYEVLEAELAGPRAAYTAWMEAPNRLDEVLDAGGERARTAARETMRRVRDRVGLR